MYLPTINPPRRSRAVSECQRRRRPGLGKHRRSRRLQLEPLEDRRLLAVVQWDGGPLGTGTDWQLAENWDGDTLPAAADDIQIGAPFSGVAISSASNVTINSLASEAALQLTSGTFSLMTDSTINNNLDLSSGTLDGSGDLTVSGLLTWTGGTMQGTGQTLAQGGLEISGSSAKVLDTRTLVNAGTGSISNTAVEGSGTLQNAAGSTLTMVSSTIATDATLTNEGLLVVQGGSSTTATMDFGNVHVGDVTTRIYRVNNDGTDGPSLRGALQTSVGGGPITDPQLSGTGVTAGNFGPIATSSDGGDLAITYTASAAGDIQAGQVAHLVNNFDNVGNQDLAIVGTAYRLADPSDHSPEPVDVGVVHIGETAEQALTVSNLAVDDGFSESLNTSLTGTRRCNPNWESRTM